MLMIDCRSVANVLLAPGLDDDTCLGMEQNFADSYPSLSSRIESPLVTLITPLTSFDSQLLLTHMSRAIMLFFDL